MISRATFAAATTAAIELRRHWRAGLIVGLSAMAAIATVGATRTLARESIDGTPALSLPRLAPAGPALMVHPNSREPAVVQSRAVADLLTVLQVVAWAAFIVAGLSILSATAAQRGSRGIEYGVQRAVGAPLSVLRGAIALEQGVLVGSAVVVGLLAGISFLLVARTQWPGELTSFMSLTAVLVPVLAAILVFAGASAVTGRTLRDRFMVAPPSEEVGVIVPTCQVAATVTVLMATVAVLWPRQPSKAVVIGADASGVVSLVDSGITDSRTRAMKYTELLERLSREPAITTVSLASSGALLGVGTTNDVAVDCGRCYEGGVAMRWHSFPAVMHVVSPGTFDTMAARALHGRTLGAADNLGAQPVAIVNRHAAKLHFDNGNGIGRRLFFRSGQPAPYIVIGVVDDIPPTGVGGPSQARASVYLSATQAAPPSIELLARGADTVAIAAAVRRNVRDVLGGGATIRTLTSETAYRAIQRRAAAWFGRVTGVAGLAVLLIALLGTVASAAAWARSVTWELSLRRAVGARRRHVVTFVLVRAARIAIGGAVGGVYVYALALAPELQRLLPSVALPPASTTAAVVAAPVLLALIVGMGAGLRILWRQSPATILN